jgi:hypothetical protein
MSRRPVPQLSFADLQLQHLGVHLDPACNGSPISWSSRPIWWNWCAGIWSGA